MLIALPVSIIGGNFAAVYMEFNRGEIQVRYRAVGAAAAFAIGDNPQRQSTTPTLPANLTCSWCLCVVVHACRSLTALAAPVCEGGVRRRREDHVKTMQVTADQMGGQIRWQPSAQPSHHASISQRPLRAPLRP